MHDEPYWAQTDQDNDRHVYVYDTNGSSDTADWTPHGEGDIPEGQTLEEWAADWHDESAALDNWTTYGDGDGGGEGEGDEEGPPGPGEEGDEDPQETDPAEEPPEEDEEGGGDGEGDGEGDGDDDGGDDDEGDEEGNGDDEGDGDGDDDEGDGEDSGDDDDGNDTSELEAALAALYDALAGVEDAMGQAEQDAADAEGRQDEQERLAEAAREEAERVKAVAAKVAGTGDDIQDLRSQVGDDLNDIADIDPMADPVPGDPVRDPPTQPATGAEPVLLYSGAFAHTAIDLQVPSLGMEVVIQRSYHSQAFVDGPLGPKWRLGFHDILKPLASGKVLRLCDDFAQTVYAPDGAGYVSAPGWPDLLERDGNGWRIRDGFGTVRRYNAAGRLLSLSDRYGNALQFGWIGGRLRTITDPGGRVYRLEYRADGRLTALVAPDNATTAYEYDSSGRLTRVVPPAPAPGTAAATVGYGYDDGADPRALHNLSMVFEEGGVTDPFTIAYGDSGLRFNRVVAQRYEGADILIDYLDGNGGTVERRTEITDRTGVVSRHDFDNAGRRLRVEVLSDGRSPGAPAAWVTTLDYDASGLISRITHPGGDVVEYTYDSGNADPLARQNLLVAAHRPARGAADADSLFQRYRYGAFNQVTRITAEDGRVTDFTIDAAGNTTQMRAPAVPRPGGGQARPTVAYTYDARGQLATRTDPNGLVTRYQRYPNGPRRGLIERVEEDAGGGRVRVVRHVLDALGRTLEIHAAGAVATWTYDTRGRPLSFARNGVPMRRWEYSRHDRLVRTLDRRTEPDGTPSVPEWVETVFEHGNDGRVRASWIEAAGAVLQRIDYRYDGEGRLTRTQGPGQADQTWAFDERGIVHAWTEAPGTPEARSVRLEHDANGQLAASFDALGAQTRYERDDLGRVIATVNPLNEREEYELDAMGRTTAIRRRDANGRLASWVQLIRDALGRLTSRRVAALDAAGAAQSWLSESTAYDLESNPVRLTSATGAASVASYDRFGFVVRQVDALGNALDYSRDLAGLLGAVVREERMADDSTLSLRYDFTRDLEGNLIASQDSMGRRETFAYDGQGRPRLTTRADGVEMRTEYDALDRPTASVLRDPASGREWRESFVWNADGHLESMIDAMNRVTGFEYDRLGRVLRITDPNNVVRQRTAWDAADRMRHWEDARGVKVDQSYDALGRILLRKITAGADVLGARSESFEYDALGNAVRTQADALVTTATFDSRNLRVAETQHGLNVRRSFDSAGRLEELRHPDDARVRFDHDALSRVRRIRIALPAGAAWPGAAAAATVAEYGWSGRELRDVVRSAGTSAQWDHDALGRPLRLRVRRGNTVMADQIVVRDRSDRVIAVDEAMPASVQRLQYESRDLLRSIVATAPLANRDAFVAAAKVGGLNAQSDLDARIAALNATGAAGWAFDHDDAGNLTRQQTPTATHSYGVDASNRVIDVDGAVIGNDPAGLLRSADGLDYGYDYAGRLCRIADAAGNALWEAQRDALGRIAAVAVAGVRQHLIHDGNHVIETRDPAGGPAQRAWIWGAHPAELALYASAGANHPLLPDWHGNAGLLLRGNGQLLERYRYGPFGERSVQDAAGATLPASAVGNERGYLMQPHLPGSALVMAGARALHTRWGRFTTPDPSGYTDGMHLYQYAGGDPYSRADRTGFSATFVGAALGFAGGAGWAAGSMINAGIHEATDGAWGERWQGFGHYGSQVAQFTASGAMIGAAVDLAPVGGGVVSAGLMGAGISGLISAPGGDWGEWAGDSAVGGAVGVGFWGAGRLLTPVAAAVLGPAVAALATTGLGRAVTAGLTRAGNTSVASAVRGAFNTLRNGVGALAEQTPGNGLMSSIAGPAMRAHANRALAGQGMSTADLALMDQIHAQTMAQLQTAATTWGGFRDAYWAAARQTPAFAQLFPGATGTGAPALGNLGRLNIHHLHGRIRDLVFRQSNLTLVPNGLDTPFLHSASYLTGTQQHLIRRGLRSLFPRQWTNGALGAAVDKLLPDGADGGVPGADC